MRMPIALLILPDSSCLSVLGNFLGSNIYGSSQEYTVSLTQGDIKDVM